MTSNDTIDSWRDYLESRYRLYANPGFIEADPVSVPHWFSGRADIEVSGFLTAIISWGSRKAILKTAAELMQRMDSAPADFITNAGESEMKRLEGFVYRTFQTTDLLFFCRSLQRILKRYHSLEDLFLEGFNAQSDFGMIDSIAHFRKVFFDDEWLPLRSVKHLPDVAKGSAAKRINMFLRWMIRSSAEGIDFGLWSLPPSALLCPLDVHSGRVARKTGLLVRKQDDLKSVMELTANLRLIDPDDPVRFDLVLFGEGVENRC